MPSPNKRYYRQRRRRRRDRISMLPSKQRHRSAAMPDLPGCNSQHGGEYVQADLACGGMRWPRLLFEALASFVQRREEALVERSRDRSLHSPHFEVRRASESYTHTLGMSAPTRLISNLRGIEPPKHKNHKRKCVKNRIYFNHHPPHQQNDSRLFSITTKENVYFRIRLERGRFETRSQKARRVGASLAFFFSLLLLSSFVFVCKTSRPPPPPKQDCKRSPSELLILHF